MEKAFFGLPKLTLDNVSWDETMFLDENIETLKEILKCLKVAPESYHRLFRKNMNRTKDKWGKQVKIMMMEYMLGRV